MASDVTHEVLVERVGNLHDQFRSHQVAVASEFVDVRETIKSHADTTVEPAKQLSEIAIWRAKIAGIFLVLIPASGGISALLIHFIEKSWK